MEFGFHLCISGSKEIDTSFVFHGFDVVDLRPVSCEVEGVSFCREESLPIDFQSYLLVEILYECHTILIVGICPVVFHIGEFLKMLGARSLVPIGTSDLKCLRKSSCHESLLPELADAYPHEDIDIVVMVMCREWSRLGSASRELDSRSLDFEKSLRLHEVSRNAPELRLAVEHRTKLIIHSHIEIALAIPLIIVTDTMPLFWKRSDRFREKSELLHKECELSLVRIKKLS